MRLGRLLTFFAVIGTPTLAWPADAPSIFSPTPAAGWIVSVGGSAQLGPKYEGASAAGLSFAPSLSWRRADEPAKFSAPDDGLDLALLETQGFSFGPVANYRPGRYPQRLPLLRGLNNIPWAIEIGLFAEYWLMKDRLRARAEVRRGFNGHTGVVVDLSADWVEKYGNWTLAAGPRAVLGNGRMINRYFGVAAAESPLVRLPVHHAKGGVKAVGAAASVSYEWSKIWTTTAFARYDRLMGDAARSPITRVFGQRNQLTLGLGAVYSFKVR